MTWWRGMPEIRLWFYNPEQDPQGLINHCVAKLDPPFCHCELQVDDGYAYAIYMGTCVLRKQRAFASPPYSMVSVSCSREQMSAVKLFADAQVQDKVPFSTLAFVLAPCSFVPYYGSGTFCSKLCADILAQGDLIDMECNARNKLTPSALYRFLTAKRINSSACKAVIDFRAA